MMLQFNFGARVYTCLSARITHQRTLGHKQPEPLHTVQCGMLVVSVFVVSLMLVYTTAAYFTTLRVLLYRCH
jgi:hypothetical protein